MSNGKGKDNGIGLLNKNPYTWSGTGLLIAGILVSPVAYFILALTWLTALGISMLILSLILLALGRTIPKLPPEVCRLFLETGNDNMAVIVEELGIRTRAIYLPSSLTGGQPQALLPLHSNSSLPVIKHALPRRLIVKYGDGPDDIGLLLSTIGSTAVSMLDYRPGHTSAELESALTSLFTGILGIADRTKVVYPDENRIQVEIIKPRIESKVTLYHRCLGGPLVSIVASVAAEAWDRPITVKREEHQKEKCLIELEVSA